METSPGIIADLQARFGADRIQPQAALDEIPTVWAPPELVRDVLTYLKVEVPKPYRTLYDLTAIDERARLKAAPDSRSGDFTIVYHLLSYDRNADVRIKVALPEDNLAIPSITCIWPSANCNGVPYSINRRAG